MVVLFILFVIQFSIACACLAVDDDAQKKIVEIGWNTTTKIANQTIIDFETAFQCCGFDSEETKVLVDGVCPGKCGSDNVTCTFCWNHPLKDNVNSAFRASGGIGLFFSLTEFVGVWLTVRFRNQKDPKGHPGAFL